MKLIDDMMKRGVYFYIAFLIALVLLIAPSYAFVTIGSFNPFKPKIISASVEPLKVVPGDTMTITAYIIDNFGISSVTADMGGIETIELVRSSTRTWQATWLVHSTEQKDYITEITATNILGVSSSIKLKWSDPAYVTANSSLLTTTINTGENTTMLANCTVTDEAASDLSIVIQNSTSSDGPFTNTTTDTNAPVYVNVTSYDIGSLLGESGNYYFNITANKPGTYYFRIQCNSSNGIPAKANSTNESLTVNQAYGYLDVTLSQPVPAATTYVIQNETFSIVANVSCASSNPTAICDEVNGTAGYNTTTENPDTPVNTTKGDDPMWTNSGNPQTCGKMNVSSGLCNLTWIVNATGEINSSRNVGVLFTSNESSITANTTEFTTIAIRSCIVDFTLQWSSISFGSLDPSTTQNAAPGNSDDEYNITLNPGCCNLDLYIRGTNMTNTTMGTKIGVSNLTWSNISDSYGDSFNLTGANVLIKNNVPANTNVTTWYWINTPAVYAGGYNGTIYIRGVESGQAP